VQTENEKAVRDFEQWWDEQPEPFNFPHRAAKAAWQAALQSQVSNTDGWVRVPVEPTNAMVEAAELDSCGRLLADDIADAYSAMLSAAPKAPQQVSNTPQDGPDFSDGHDWEGFPGGCERFGCTSNCSPPQQQEQSGEAFDKWLADNERRMHCGHFTDREMMRAAYEAGRNSSTATPTATAVAAMVIKQAADLVRESLEGRAGDMLESEILALTPANAEAELEALMMRVAELRDQESAKGYMDAAYQVSDAAIVRRVLDEKGE
jgi:hypothetical protein